MKGLAKITILILYFLLSFNASSVGEVRQFSLPDNPELIFKDKELNRKMKILLGGCYSDFINNFEIYGEPKLTPSGGFFTEGWMQDLRMENASAMVVEPNGGIYVAWLIPENGKIEYRTNVKSGRAVNSYIKDWAERFSNVSFDEKKYTSNQISEEPLVRHFDSQKFTINLTLICSEEDSGCNSVLYEGKRRSDGATLMLKGKAIRSRCEKDICPVNSYRFVNNGTVYLLDTHLSSLMVIDKKGIVLLDEKGSWSYGNK
ncbi:amidohydrolase family protein [Erwinia oleae]|uniref:hypothetical protein n=1 Tax=Erwinia oleae TaxID=796334 RepID=UPI00054E4DFE|nr:hypothetical protein [Erwinia oleae]